MIQRPQTLLLGLIIILMIAALFLPNWEKLSSDKTQLAVQDAMHLTLTKGPGANAEVQSLARYYIAGLMVLVAGLSAFSISQFANRKRQMLVGFLISVTIALTLVSMMVGMREGESFFEPTRQGRFLTGFYTLFIAYFANIVSNRLIRKDENLVRSMDRIR